MESASIWDIYSNAKKLIPLYDRMQNRALRQSSSSAQRKTQLGDTTNVSESPMNEVKNDWIGISMLNDDISQMEDITTNLSYFNNNHDTNMISVDLLTPLSSSPGNNSNTNTTLAGLAPSGLTTCISNGSSNVNTSSTAIATTTTTKANVTATNLGASKNPAVNESSSTDNGNKSLFQNQRSSKNTGKPVTPNSLTESPNDNAITNSKGNLNAQANINTNSNNKFAFSDIIDFNHDDFLNEHENYESFDFINNFQQLEKDFRNKGSNENINGESSSNIHITQNHIDNEKQSNEIQTIRPVDIKVKSNSSVSVNNENIVSGKSNLPESENNHSSSSNAKPTKFISTSIPNLSSAKPKTKIIKFNNEKLDCASPSSPSSRVHISSTPQPNELQTQARQSNKISFSAPNKENSKLTKCNNCGTSKTPLWRKDPSGNTLCNACGLFLKLHGTMRPLSLKTDVIKKRNSKRQSLSNQGEGYKNLAHLSQSQNQKLYTNTGVMNTGIYFPQSLPNHSNFSTINDSIPLQFHQKSQLHSQPQQNIIQKNILPRSKSQKSRTSLNHVQLQSQLQSQFQVQSVSQFPTSSGSTPASVSNGNKKVKNVPILPKPLNDGSLPGTPTSAAQISSSFSCPSTQPQDIPQFKRRKSKLSLASLSSFQNSQPSSPMTVIPSNVPSYSPSPSPSSFSVMYSPGNHTFNNNTANSNIESPSFFGNNSRQNSISSSHSFSSHLYNDLNSKRGLTFSNSNQNNGAANNSSFGGLSLSFQNQRQNQQPPSNFSNLSAGINAIKTHNDDNISSNYSGSNFKSGLGKCVVTHNDGGTEANMEDLDWLKFDI